MKKTDAFIITHRVTWPLTLNITIFHKWINWMQIWWCFHRYMFARQAFQKLLEWEEELHSTEKWSFATILWQLRAIIHLFEVNVNYWWISAAGLSQYSVYIRETFLKTNLFSFLQGWCCIGIPRIRIAPPHPEWRFILYRVSFPLSWCPCCK